MKMLCHRPHTVQRQRPQAPQFDDHVRSSKRDALLVAGLHLVSRFLGFCALSWATVVLLGGFASTLRFLDLYLISILLLLEGARLFIVQVFSKLISRAFFGEHVRPEYFTFTDRQPSMSLRLDLIGQFLSFVLATASLAFAIARFVLASHGHSLSQKAPANDGSNTNLPTSLRIFYILVICNSSFAVASCLLRPLLRHRCHGKPINLAACFHCSRGASAANVIDQDSLMCFHDEVYKTAMEEGLPEADKLEVLEFAFTKIASDYKRNIRPPLIKELNKDLIKHLYAGQHGIAMACEYLKEGGDVWKQLVAANLPGFWAEESRIELQVALFWALRGRVYGAGRDSESALNSMERLGRVWADNENNRRPVAPNDPQLVENNKPYPFLVNDPTAGTNVVETLVDLLLEPIRPTLLFQVRALEACCRHPQVLRHLYKEEEEAGGGHVAVQDLILADPAERARPMNRLRSLCCKLQGIVAAGPAGRTWTATNIYAGSALVSLLCCGRPEQLKLQIKDFFAGIVENGIKPADVVYPDGKRPYFWESDLEVVERLRFRLGLDPYSKWRDVRLRRADGTAISEPLAGTYEEEFVANMITKCRQ